jgi:hypothetical protein
MRLSLLLAAISFSFNVAANSDIFEQMEFQMDENLSILEIERNQQDRALFKAQTKSFLTELEYLINGDGLSREEIMELAESTGDTTEFAQAGRLVLYGNRLIEKGSIARIYFRESQMVHPSMVSLMDVDNNEFSLVRFGANNVPIWENPTTAHRFPPLQSLLLGKRSDACYTGTLTAMQWFIEILLEKTQAELLSSTASRNDRTFRLRFSQLGKNYEIFLPFCK